MRFQPKRFAPPKSRAARENEAEELFGPVTSADILKDAWPMGGCLVRPWWAKTARKFGWITSAEYYAIEATEPDPDPLEMLYETSPFLQMIRRAS